MVSLAPPHIALFTFAPRAHSAFITDILPPIAASIRGVMPSLLPLLTHSALRRPSSFTSFSASLGYRWMTAMRKVVPSLGVILTVTAMPGSKPSDSKSFGMAVSAWPLRSAFSRSGASGWTPYLKSSGMQSTFIVMAARRGVSPSVLRLLLGFAPPFSSASTVSMLTSVLAIAQIRGVMPSLVLPSSTLSGNAAFLPASIREATCSG
mmetsp:Transcript_42473/g.98846  ORF Transcript_42473/g.98846 Transcript_42473/m.98846 type:complete len:207 (+) Transcript_42473:591-1211(+)